MDHRAKILIIDDEDIVLDSCADMLRGADYELFTASDGLRGLGLCQDLHPDLIFVDLKMPGISGTEVLERIHQIDSSLVTIVITGFSTVDSAVEAMKKGAFDFLPKPFTPDEFRLITQRGLEKRELVLETISLRREREVLREHFAAILSHELKAPLGAAQQNLFVLTEEVQGQLTAPQRQRLERIKGSIDSLMKLIHSWLRLYTLDVDKAREAFRPTSIEAVVDQAIETVRPHADRKDVTIESGMQSPLAPVNGDETTLVEALVNILGNAVKYSRVGSRVLLAAKQEADDVVVSVADSGPGISADDLPFIFDDFFSGRSDPGAERGSGLGLAITRRIVQAHGGAIGVDSQVGRGSTFVVRLPTLNKKQDQPMILTGASAGPS